MPRTKPMNPTKLISDYTAAFVACNKMSDPPTIEYSRGWFTFKSPRTPPRRYRRIAVERMRNTLLDRARIEAEPR